jgi:hypothetical protein
VAAPSNASLEPLSRLELALGVVMQNKLVERLARQPQRGKAEAVGRGNFIEDKFASSGCAVDV